MIKYTSLGSYKMSRGVVFLVENDKERDRSNMGLIGEEVIIDGEKYIVKGVEAFLTIRISKGEKIGLLI